MKRGLAVFVMLVILECTGISEAVVRDGAIRGKEGLSFGSISYSFRGLNVTIKNRTKYNVNFGGTMLFLDRNYNLVARAELLNRKIKRYSSRRYKGFFTYGNGEAAKGARYLEWEF